MKLKRIFVTALLAAGLGAMTVGCSTTGGGPVVSEEKIAELIKASENNPDGMMKVGDAYAKNKDYTNAKMWYDKAKAAFDAMKK